MNKMCIRILCLIFAVVMSFSALAACSNEADNSSSNSSSSKKDVSSQTNSDDTTDNIPDDNNESNIPEDEDSAYDDLVETPSDDYGDDEYILTSKLNIYNAKPVQEDFMGFGGVYHAFTYRSDLYGRQYDDKMAQAEIDRVINSGITIARSYYEIPNAWDEKTGSWDWDSEEMQAIYKCCLGLKKGDVEMLMNHWYCSNYLFETYPWRDATPEGVKNECHVAIRVEGDQEKTLENFAVFMSETVKQFRARGCTNMTTISIATEPYCTWKEEWADVISKEERYNAASKDIATALNKVNARLKTDGIRNTVKIMGPNFAGVEDAAYYYKYFKKHIEADACDLISLHTYQGRDLTSDNYELWKNAVEIYKTEVGSFENFVFDEYNCSPAAEESIEARHNSYNGVQLALAQVCFMNYGMKSSFVWSLLDQQWPNNSATSTDSFRDGVHMCGTAPTFLLSSIVFPPYYSFSLVAKALGDKGAKVYRGDDDTYDGVYTAMTENKNGDVSIIVVSTNIEDTAVEINFEKSLGGKTLYRHVYNPNSIVCTAEGEMINPDLKLTNTTTMLKDVVSPYCVVVYTTKKLVAQILKF